MIEGKQLRLIVAAALVLLVVAVGIALTFWVTPLATIQQWKGGGFSRTYNESASIGEIYVSDPYGSISIGAWNGTYVKVICQGYAFPGSFAAFPEVGEKSGALDVVVPAQQFTLTYVMNVEVELPNNMESPVGITASSIDGNVYVMWSNAPEIYATTVDGNVYVNTTYTQQLVARTTNGDVHLYLDGSESAAVDSVNGGIFAAVRDPGAGAYSFRTTNGDVTVMLPENASARISVYSSNGAYGVSGLQYTQSLQSSSGIYVVVGTGAASITATTVNGNAFVERG
ncbi:MAG TPA: hypothetical protein ENO38_05375 [Nitrososphaeria archaeon]|nr:DUF4097 family beta strand repeat-containing protein [Conexivisphaerales archaeon]HEU17081.1 hypothetical protein [Nitrososphaeria archaeon]